MQSKGRPAGDRRGEARLFPRLLAVLVAVVAVGLVSAPGAGASLGLTGYFEFPRAASFDPGFATPGTFSDVIGGAVNHNGTGGATPGDIYMLDPRRVVFSEDGRVQQFGATGEFKREWDVGGALDDIAVNQDTGNVYVSKRGRIEVFSATGELLRTFGYDAVSTGPGDTAHGEQQRVTVIATGGTFALRFSGQTTLPLPFNAPANDSISGTPGVVDSVEEALNQLAVFADNGATMTVTGGPGDATGSNPYVIEFGGSLSGEDVTTIGVLSSELTGATTAIRVRELVPGSAFEVCIPANGDVCHGRFQAADVEKPVNGSFLWARSLAIAPSGAANAGNLVTGDDAGGFSRLNEYTSGGDFIRSFGWDVTSHGPNDGSVDEEQTVTVGGNTTGGKFSLSFEGETTGATGNGEITAGSDTIVNVSTSNGSFGVGQVLTATGVPAGTTITAVDTGAGTVTLSANASSGASTSRALTAFDIGFDAGAAEVETALNSLSTIGGVGGSVNVSGAAGGPYSVTFAGNFGGDDLEELGSSAQGLSVSGGSKSVAIATVADGGSFEVCVDAAGDVCKGGVRAAAPGPDGAEPGQFRGDLTGVAQDSAGAVYAVDSPPVNNQTQSNFRVQKFTPSGPGFTPSVFGAAEKQEVTVSAGSGQFRLSYYEPDGTTGTGTPQNGSPVLTDVTTTEGEFEVGQPIYAGNEPGDFGIPAGTTIVAVGPGPTLTLSNPASGNWGPGQTLHSTRRWETGDLDHDAAPAVVESALNGLGGISADGGSVSVSGGPGDPSGSSPYVVSFDGGPLRTLNHLELVATDGTTSLSGGSGPGADQAVVATILDGAPSGRDVLDTPIDIAVDDSGNVFVTSHVPAGTASCAADGSPSPFETRIRRFQPNGDFSEISAPCLEIDAFGGDLGGPRYLPNLTVDPVSGEPYLTYDGGTPAFADSFAKFALIFGDLGAQPDLTLNPPSEITATGVKISGEITPHGPASAAGHPNPSETTYTVEYKKDSESTWETYAPATGVGVGDTAVPFNVGVSGLTPKTAYDFRVAASKLGLPPVTGAVQTVSTGPAAPTIDTFSSSNITADSADLHALINPLGTATSYHFEYGPTPAYGKSTPEVDIGDSLSPQAVTAHIENLEPIVYHFRVVATNAVGTTESHNQTFNFYPEPCPNAAVRQQTGSGGLPDCRAYELVSPEDAGSANLGYGGPNSPVASSPARHAFLGYLGAIPGPWNPRIALARGDQYIATRTSTGWRTVFVGIPGDLNLKAGGPPNEITNPSNVAAGPMSDLSMDRMLEWDHGGKGAITGNEGRQGSMAPYVWDTGTGDSLGRWPTNLEEIPGSKLQMGEEGGWIGDVRPSPDFSHYFFSSADLAFAPGGLTTGNGSVYDNEIATGDVTIASKRPDGSDIPNEPGDQTDDWMMMPAASTDGSRILMAAASTGLCGEAVCPVPVSEVCGLPVEGPFPCPTDLPSHLYMRVDGALTYDVSQGHAVRYEGMTDNGRTVYFTSAEQITADDTDASVDLYAWAEATDEVSRISAGAGSVGNSDSCNATWVSDCDVEVVPPSESTGGRSVYRQTDNAIAAESADVYFYSPEQFVGSDGIPGRRNLYVHRDGQIRYVTTLDANEPASRIQVSPDGEHMAFITATQITPYDNAGFDQMYSFEPDSGELRCVSCLPSGDSPSADVEGSRNGIFMSDDGRAFFSTADAVVPEDTNGLIDVYEYSGGRARLISSGTAATDEVRLFGKAGLVGVSADGVDVYFATFRKLVAGDKNGQRMRFYDARTNGGFPLAAEVAPCEAADECRDESSTEAVAPRVSSSAQLGGAGNARLDRCARVAKRTRKHALRTRALRGKARRLSRRGTASSRRLARLRGRARRSAVRTRRMRAKARRCRTARRLRAGRRGA